MLGRLLEDLDLQLPRAVVGIRLEAEPLAHLAQIGPVAQRERIDTRTVLDERLLDRDAAECFAEVVVAPLVADLAGAVNGIAQAPDRLLDPVHEITIIGVREVQLEHREFRVVLRRQALVAEVAVDLVDALEAADQQALQIQLGRDAQIHIQIERVVVRDERAGRRTARNRLHHRGLDFEKLERIEEIPQVTDDPRARAEHVAARFVDDQVDIAPPIAQLGVGEPVPLVGQRPQRLHQQAQAVHAHRQLARLGAEQHAARADDVADVPALERLVGRTERIVLQEQLQLPGAIGDLREARLAHQALEQHAAADAHPCRICFEPLLRALAERGVQLARERVPPQVIRIRKSRRAQLRQLRAPLRDELVLVAEPGVTVAVFRFCHVSLVTCVVALPGSPGN